MRSRTLDDTAAALQAAGSRLEEEAAPKSFISSTVIALIATVQLSQTAVID